VIIIFFLLTFDLIADAQSTIAFSNSQRKQFGRYILFWSLRIERVKMPYIIVDDPSCLACDKIVDITSKKTLQSSTEDCRQAFEKIVIQTGFKKLAQATPAKGISSAEVVINKEKRSKQKVKKQDPVKSIIDDQNSNDVGSNTQQHLESHAVLGMMLYYIGYFIVAFCNPVLLGLVNLRNTCYFNSALQAVNSVCQHYKIFQQADSVRALDSALTSNAFM